MNIDLPTGNAARQKRAMQGYTAHGERRDNCKGCKHASDEFRDPDTPFERRVLTCGIGGFAVSHGAICEQWSAKS